MILTIALLSVNASTEAQASSKHAYTKQRVSVLNSKGKKVASLSKGITFKYSSEKNGKVKFNYFGATRYVSTRGLVTNNSLKSYIAKNPSKFGVRLRTSRAAKVQGSPTGGKTLKVLAAGEELESFGRYGNCYKVLINDKFGYVNAGACSRYCLVDVTQFPTVSGRTKGEKIVSYAKKFVGNPYVWGGTSLTNGADCSGFVQAVYKAFGYSLPRCSKDQALKGRPVSLKKLQPGDLIFYKRGSGIGHVTMYAGNGMCVQARGRAYGIVMTRYDYSTPAWARRII